LTLKDGDFQKENGVIHRVRLFTTPSIYFPCGKAPEKVRHANGKAQCPTGGAFNQTQTNINMNILVHQVPRPLEGVISVSAQCIIGANALAAELDIKQNDGPAIAAARLDLVGAPGSDPATAGKQGQLNQKRLAFLSAQTARQIAVAAGREYNERAIDTLKGYLGRRWNPHCAAAGFTGGSLALPRNPLSLLLQFRAYFSVNATHENPANNVTAARAHTLPTALEQAVDAEAATGIARDDARRARDESLETLRSRVVGLRGELEQLLDGDDMRWRRFGFARPVDRRIPKVVTGLTVSPSMAPGEIIVEWAASVGAENYRVLRQVQTVDAEPIEVGLFSDRIAIIRDLPSGKNVVVFVTARNPAGETSPTSRLIAIA
jgi:hypothetical protein